MGGSRPGKGRGATGKRLVCIVEGKGEVEAVPSLCLRIRDHLQAWAWFVDPQPVRLPRSMLVDERTPSPRRPARSDQMDRAIDLAMRRPADAVLAMCDADDDCAACWGPSAQERILRRTRGGAVMAVREFEAWLLISHLRGAVHEGRRLDEIRDAKGSLRRVIGEYTPTVHQRKLTERIDLNIVRYHSDSFDKLVRTLAVIFQVPCPPRPGSL